MGLAASPPPASNRDQNVKLNTIGMNLTSSVTLLAKAEELSWWKGGGRRSQWAGGMGWA
jgi:hypothetical protein